MNWIPFALMSPAIYTVNNYLDKYLISNKIKDYRAITIYSAIVGFLAGTFFWVVTGFPILDLFDAGIVIFTGLLTIWGIPIYFKALSEEETTTIIILFQSIAVISLILAFFILGETITQKQLVGFMVVLVAGILATLKRTGGKFFSLSPAFFYVLAFNFMWALAGVLIKFAINATSFQKILPYESWGIGLGGLILFIFFPGIRNAFLQSLKYLKKTTINVVIVNEVIFVLGKAVTFLAYSLGPVGLVSVIGGTQVFYGLLYGFVLTTIFPKSFDEDIRKEVLLKKGLLAVLMVLGIYLLS